MNILFEKCHGLENDYLFVNLFTHPSIPETDLPWITRVMSHRKRGPGADGLVLFGPSDTSAARMRIFNVDGSEAQICGNALRCVARILYEDRWVSFEAFSIETGAGQIPVRIVSPAPSSFQVELNMGAPRWNRCDIPMLGDGEAIDVPITLGNETFRATCLSVGNPHCVVFNPSTLLNDLQCVGPQIETMSLFPERINIEFCTVIDRSHLLVNVWERGSGLTAACGTGATASFAAGRRLGILDSTCRVELPGGNLEFHEIAGRIIMRGPAVRVYSGTCDPSLLQD